VGGSDLDSIIGNLFSPQRLDDLWPMTQAAAVLPYLTVNLVLRMGLGDADGLDRLSRHSSLVSPAGNAWRLHASAVEVVRPLVADDVAAGWRRAAAIELQADDPVVAIDLLIAAADFEAAGDLMARRAPEITADRATRWVYQLPADVRRRLPPVLAGGRATVNVDLAILSARKQLDERSRAEGLRSLGSLLMAAPQAGMAIWRECSRRCCAGRPIA
jgi:hypothetical protein